MAAISSISILIKAVTKPFVAGIKAASSAALSFTGIIKNLGVGLIKFSTLAIAGLSAALGALSLKSIMTASSFEKLKIQFKAILGSTDAAVARMKELQKFATTTPFQLKDIAAASRVLQTLTKGILATGEGLRLVGDAAASQNQPIQELAVHIGRIFSGAMSGRAVGESLARLQELGIISAEARAQFEDLQKAGVKGQKVWDTIAGELKKTNGAMADLSKTAAGLFSTLKDNLDELFNEIGKLLLPIVKVLTKTATDGFSRIAKWIKENSSLIVSKLIPALKKILPIFVQIKNAAKVLFTTLAKALSGVQFEKILSKVFMSIQKFFINIEFGIKNFEKVWLLTWRTILLYTEDFMRNIITVIISPFRLIGTNIIETFKYSFTTIKDLAAIAFKLIGKLFEASFTRNPLKMLGLTQELEKLNTELEGRLNKGLANFNFIGIDEATQLSRKDLDDLLGSLDPDFNRLNKEWENLNKKLLEFQKMRIKGNKEEIKKLVDEIEAMFKKAKIKIKTEDVDKTVDKIKDVAKETTKMFNNQLPTLAKKGSQAAAMGELQQVNIEKQVLKQAQLHTQILRQIEQNQRLAPGAGAPVNFGFN